MKLSVIVLFLVLFLIKIQCGIVRNIVNTVTGEIHQVAEGIHNFVSPNKHNNGENGSAAGENKSVFGRDKSLESVHNGSENDLFDTKEQSFSRDQAYKHLRKDKTTGKNKNFQEYDKGTEHISESNNHVYTANSGITNIEEAEKTINYDKLYTKQYTSKHTNEDSGKEATTPKYTGFNEAVANGDTSAFNTNNKTHVVNGSDDRIQMPGYKTGIVNNEENIAKNDAIVFPGASGHRTQNTSCPEGLVMTADGACLKPKIIYMGNKTQNFATSRQILGFSA